jgi:uncharacterized protein (TIGR02246 family)
MVSAIFLFFFFQPSETTLVAEVESVVQGIIAADNAGDLEAVLAHYTDDAVLLPPNGPIVDGKEAIMQRYRAGFEQFRFEVAITLKETKISGRWAFNRGVTQGRLVPLDGGEARSLNDRYLMILRQTPEGWKIARLIWNSAK